MNEPFISLSNYHVKRNPGEPREGISGGSSGLSEVLEAEPHRSAADGRKCHQSDSVTLGTPCLSQVEFLPPGRCALLESVHCDAVAGVVHPPNGSHQGEPQSGWHGVANVAEVEVQQVKDHFKLSFSLG